MLPWSRAAIDFINGLVVKNPKLRLGCDGIEELKNHKWMKSIDWVKL